MSSTKWLLFIFGLSLCECRRVKFFRRDYKYVSDFDAFYKLHDVVADWEDALQNCDNEGATLFYPLDYNEISSVLKVLELNNETELFIGLHDTFNIGQYITIDGNITPMPLLLSKQKAKNVVAPISDGSKECILLDAHGNYKVGSCETKRQFICKKEDNSPCPTIDSEYVYKKTTGKCYKVNKHKLLFTEAVSTCFNEGARLYVDDDKRKLEIIASELKLNEYYHVGALQLPSGQILSSKGIEFLQLSNENIHVFSCMKTYIRENEYNGRDRVTYSDCNERLQFVCEMDTNY